jgi:pyruvate dehydrogenase E2 component (dihydrolipoamide acetyltransferase)
MPELVMPKMGDSMEEGTILRWLKNEGDRLEEGDIIAEIQTEKAAIEIPVTDAGTLTRIVVKEGETVPVGTPIAEIDGPTGGAAKTAAPTASAAPEASAKPSPNGVAADHEAAPGQQTPAAAEAAAPSPAPEPAAPAASAPGSEGRVKASPLARKVAAEYGVDLASVAGTGPGGRIIEADVEEARNRVPALPATGGTAPATAGPGLTASQRPMSPMRKIIAKRLSQSKQSIPHFYLTLDVDMRAAVRLRGEYNTAIGEERKVSINDLVIRACALAITKFPALNSQLDGETIRTLASVNVGVAVSLEEGLIVPVVRDAQQKSVGTIGAEVRALAERARKGQLKPEEYSGGTFTVSNLGMYEITQFQAIINQPEAAILAVGAVRDTPIVENGAVIPGKQMYVTVSVDHRLVDGQVAARFLQEVKRLLQAPIALFG